MRIELQRLVEIRNRPREVILRKPRGAALRPGFGQFRVECQRAVQIAQRTFRLAFQEPHPGPFRLDVAERLLMRDGQSVPLTPKAFDLLLAVVERHGRLVDKEELF